MAGLISAAPGVPYPGHQTITWGGSVGVHAKRPQTGTAARAGNPPWKASEPVPNSMRCSTPAPRVRFLGNHVGAGPKTGGEAVQPATDMADSGRPTPVSASRGPVGAIADAGDRQRGIGEAQHVGFLRGAALAPAGGCPSRRRSACLKNWQNQPVHSCDHWIPAFAGKTLFFAGKTGVELLAMTRGTVRDFFNRPFASRFLA